ncbi:helicase-exonuclease AddAB subunit AddA [Aquibacillus sp. 3ASR75-11]|uniref:ATP-dependent helicase/nuclease subunit A n=1 Tax=Terrihalobacillus insolitus TaxID=2950438 RepID=A0A9X4AMQ6_9BACI|nr:helicase-exonuclease AddAB subunit AddA [Terrihalobacillus insolitus]MDC3425591.1 helicase-exonuclease AddAB subunit AddA [Terrihalobacillus insolitus]
MVSWTKEQEEAIHTNGRDILVAAAAGSGKTAVLVERIIQKLLDKNNPVDIDSLLVVTFTNAAAQEMRHRIGQAIEAALEKNPTSTHLKKQLSLLQRASISTLHAFCMEVVRRHAYMLDLDPGFRIADDMEADMIRQEVMEELFEHWYGKVGEEQTAFFSVVDRFSNDRSDLEVEELVMKLYEFAMQKPWPGQWLTNMATMYDIPEQVEEADLEWLTILKREVQSQLNAMEAEAISALDLTRESDGPYHYADAIDADLHLITEAKRCLQLSWDDLQKLFLESKFQALSRKKVDCSEEKKDKLKGLRNSYKKRWNDLAEDWFSRRLSSYLDDMRTLYPTVEQLIVLVKEFKEKYAQAKKEKAIVDFSDLEHFCLQVLVDPSSDSSQIVPSYVSTEFRKKFTEVLVDEYQDTNLVQETLLSLISNKDGAGNMFMVGDVKQSIYRFRHAEPTLFLNKYKEFAVADHPGKRIDLARNFRSRTQVLAATNYIFRQLLNEEVGEMNYDEDAELIYANKMYDELTNSDTDVELVIIDRESKEEEQDDAKEDEDFQDLEKAQLEARTYARMIKKWIGYKASPMQVIDKATGVQRDVRYRDIVILLRSMTWAPTIVDELKQEGIPVYAELSTGYLEAIEIKVMLSLLKVIDNPKQDIPLAAILRSPIVGLNEEDLAQIRLAKRRAPYHDALKAFVAQSSHPKIARIVSFLNQLNEWRSRARQGALSELIWQIYRETGYYDFVGGIPGGRQRQANLRALYDRARSYESTSFRGLFRFLRFIERMEERGDDLGAARALGEQEDVVRMMTIHKSKGLEFPVVILGAMDKQFNQQDIKQKYLLHKDLGFGSKYIDPIKRIMYPTLAFHALKKEKQRELLAEEMRVLYVALTRAKEKLVMVGNVASFEKKQEKWQQLIDHPEWVLPAHYRLESKSYLDWIGPALIRHHQNEVLRDEIKVSVRVPEEIQNDVSSWDVRLMHGSALTRQESPLGSNKSNLEKAIRNWEPLLDLDPSLDEAVEKKLAYQYPHPNASTYRAKQSVTELKRQREWKDEYSGDQLLETYKAPIGNRPRFMQKEKRLTAAEKGSAMHAVMQHLPLTKKLTTIELEEHVQGIVTKEIITQEEADTVDVGAIKQFFQTNIGEQLIQAVTIYREVPFSLTLPANEVYAEWDDDTDERVLIQGVIDCAIRHEGGWIILDYKTDTVPSKGSDEDKEVTLKKRYETQLDLYATAVEEIWKEPVVGKYLYFFDGGLLIEL